MKPDAKTIQKLVWKRAEYRMYLEKALALYPHWTPERFKNEASIMANHYHSVGHPMEDAWVMAAKDLCDEIREQVRRDL